MRFFRLQTSTCCQFFHDPKPQTLFKSGLRLKKNMTLQVGVCFLLLYLFCSFYFGRHLHKFQTQKGWQHNNKCWYINLIMYNNTWSTSRIMNCCTFFHSCLCALLGFFYKIKHFVVFVKTLDHCFKFFCKLDIVLTSTKCVVYKHGS